MAIAVAPTTGIKSSFFYPAGELYDINCREDVGAELSSVPKPTYAPREFAYLVSGCRPSFLASKPRTWY